MPARRGESIVFDGDRFLKLRDGLALKKIAQRPLLARQYFPLQLL